MPLGTQQKRNVLDQSFQVSATFSAQVHLKNQTKDQNVAQNFEYWIRKTKKSSFSQSWYHKGAQIFLM